MLLHEYLTATACRIPGKVALVAGKQRATYGQLAEGAEAFRGFLLSQGLVKGDRVAVYLDNSVDAVIAIFGILEAGGCIVVINPATQPERLGYIVDNCNARYLVASIEKLGHVQQAEKVCTAPPVRILTGVDDDTPDGLSFRRIMMERRQAPAIRLVDVDLAAIVYTSGSTGKPKGVTHLHRSINAAVESVREYLQNTGEDVILNFLPLSSSYGLLQLLVTFRTGGRLVLEKGFGYPYEIVKRIQEEMVTGFAGAPTVFAILLKLENVDPSAFETIRYVTNAAAALPASFVPRLRKMLPHAKIFLMHGLTECLRTTYLPPEEVETRPTSVGTGMPNVELWVEDADGQRLPPGHVGEMIVRSSTLMAGYWNDPEGTAKALIPGRYPWEKVLRTRDLFTMDEEGYFYFVARSDELIKCRGEKVSPIEVEDVIYTLDPVLETRVIGVSDSILGQAVKAEIVLKEGRTLSVQEVRTHCRRFLEDFKVPTIIEFVGSLPKTQGGKIRRSGVSA